MLLIIFNLKALKVWYKGIKELLIVNIELDVKSPI